MRTEVRSKPAAVARLSGVHCWTHPHPTPLTEIAEVTDNWNSRAPGISKELGGVSSVSRLNGELSGIITSCVEGTLRLTGTLPFDCDRLIVASSDTTVASIPPDLGRTLVRQIGLDRCVPMLVSWQQCCSLIAALSTAAEEVRAGAARKILVVGLDFTCDSNRLHSFGVFGDAVCCALVSTESEGLVISQGSVCSDPAGWRGEDTFASRQKALTHCLVDVGYDSSESKERIEAIFPTNTFAPLVMFTAAAGGLPRGRMQYAFALDRWGHCGVVDPLLNLTTWEQSSTPDNRDAEYLLLGTAPGFYGALRLRKEP
ncbi:3-oxoacyl-(acyl carrier protein) synthase III [Mycobacteroides abscessus subsp. bolletii]|nr:3-oxoacyl-(acyl carrier protein) synthase III [Mycobacteroides abscessus subsp. bolletii]